MILFSSAIGPIPVSVIMSERHSSTLGITENPIETGAKITDHAYVEPKRLTLEFADANAAGTYNTLVRFQESRVPFVAVSGLYVYQDMLIKSLDAERDARTSRILSGKVELQQVLIVSTAYTSTEGEAGSQTGTSANNSKKANPGGKKSTSAARPTTERATDSVTKDRAAGTTMRGDASPTTVPPTENRSIASRLLGA